MTSRLPYRVLCLIVSLAGAQTACITEALHEAAFPTGYDLNYADDVRGLERAGDSFSFCVQTGEGLYEFRVTGDYDRSYAMPLANLSVLSAERVWKAERNEGCKSSGRPGVTADSKLILFPAQAAALPAVEIRPVTAEVSERVARLEISSNGEKLRVTLENGKSITLRRAGPGQYGIFSGLDERPFIPSAAAAGTESFLPVAMRELSGAVAIYYRRADGALHLKLFENILEPGSQTAVIYVPYVTSQPAANRYYLLPLYPFAIALDILTGVLQVFAWYEDSRSWRTCLQ